MDGPRQSSVASSLVTAGMRGGGDGDCAAETGREVRIEDRRRMALTAREVHPRMA